MEFRRMILFVLMSVLALSVVVSGQNTDKLPKLNIEEFTLPNGLRVIMHRDTSTPIVAVNVWYHVGSKNEVKGRTGFAHLFEHMMFQGSKNYNDDYFKPLQEAGANINGSTNPDRTNYYEVVPSNFLELALFMESDRMGGLLDAMTMEKLNNQRDVVKNERRQNYDNRPYGTAFEKIQALMYPEDHPYHWTTIGSLEDLSNASMEDVKSFFRQYYVPNNASLVIAGDFDAAQAKQWVEKYFGGIKRGADIVRPKPAQAKLNGEIRKEYEDAIQLPRRYMVWHTPGAHDKDEAPLDVLASILSDGRGSRLQSKLVYEKQMVQSIFANNSTRELAGGFMIVPTARPGQSLDAIEAEINLDIEALKATPPSIEEVQRAVNGVESQFIQRIQTVLGKADQMNSNATFTSGPDTFQEQLDAYRNVKPADVQRVAKQYLNKDRLVMTFVKGENQGAPGAGRSDRPTSTADEAAAVKKPVDKTDYSANLPKAGPDPKFTLPAIQKTKLSNGLEVWVVPQRELPIVSMNLVFNAGSAFNPEGREGLADLTADLINTGTKSRSATDISNQLQSIGASMNVNAGWDSSEARLQTLTKHLDTALDIYSDVLINPTFSLEELETVKKRRLVGFRQRQDSPVAIAGLAYSKLLYGESHPYGRPQDGDEKSINAVTRGDLIRYYNKYYRPNNAALIIAGDVSVDEIKPKLEKAFAAWKAADVPVLETLPPEPFKKPGIYLIDKPGAAQSELRIGHFGVSRNDADYIPIRVMNQILGGQFSARVNMNLREDKGYTYGARTGFDYRKGVGPFTASAGVQTAVTMESVVEFMKELRGIRGPIPVTAAELDYSKQSMIRGYPRTVETVGQITGQFADLFVYKLPDTYINDYLKKVSMVNLRDVKRVATKYVVPNQMVILIVGDRKSIEPGLKTIKGWGSRMTFLDTDGNVITETK